MGSNRQATCLYSTIALAVLAYISLAKGQETISGWASFYGEEKGPNVATYGLLEGACGYGEFARSVWPYWDVASLGPGNPLLQTGLKGACGVCLEVTCADGAKCNTGMRPFPVLVTDSCPGCGPTQLNLHMSTFIDSLAPEEFGIVNVTYRQVPCLPPAPIAVNVTKYRLDLGGYLSLVLLQVAGESPVTKVELRESGGGFGYRPLTNTYGATWELSGFGPPAYDLRITNGAGMVLVASRAITTASVGSYPTAVQFPVAAGAPAPGPGGYPVRSGASSAVAAPAGPRVSSQSRLLQETASASSFSQPMQAIASNYGGPQDGKSKDVASFGIEDGSCGYGLLSRSEWPFWSAVSLAPSNPIASQGLPKLGCGVCLEITCSDPGACVSTSPVTVLVTDTCPTCTANQLNLHASVFVDKLATEEAGVANVTYRQVPCAPPGFIQVDVSKYRGELGGYLSLNLQQVAGSSPVQSIKLRESSEGGEWKDLTNTYGATWELSVFGAPPYDLQIANTAGETLLARGVITDGRTGTFPSSVQFGRAQIAAAAAPEATPAPTAAATPSPTAAAASPSPSLSPTPSPTLPPAAAPLQSPPLPAPAPAPIPAPAQAPVPAPAPGLGAPSTAPAPAPRLLSVPAPAPAPILLSPPAPAPAPLLLSPPAPAPAPDALRRAALAPAAVPGSARLPLTAPMPAPAAGPANASAPAAGPARVFVPAPQPAAAAALAPQGAVGSRELPAQGPSTSPPRTVTLQLNLGQSNLSSTDLNGVVGNITVQQTGGTAAQGAGR